MAGHITRLKDKQGNYIKRADGSPVWRARYPDPLKGGTAQIEKRFRSKGDAQSWLKRRGVAVLDGTHIDRSKAETRFADVADAWRGTWADLEPKTRAGYEAILKKHVLPRYGKAKVAAVDAEAIQKHMNSLAVTHAPNTVRRIYGVVRGILRVAVERGHIRSNPADAVRLPKKKTATREARGRMLFLDPSEVRALAEAMPAVYRLPLYVAAYCGLRAGELWALRRRDVDLLHGVLHVEQALKEISSTADSVAADTGLIFGPTKTHQTRKLTLPAFLVPLLTEHLASDSPGGSGPDDLLFPSPTGKPMRHGLFYRRIFKPTVKGRAAKPERKVPNGNGWRTIPAEPAIPAALPERLHGLRWHDLRHTCASLSLAVAPNLHIVKERLGHEDIRTTINVYGHLLPSVDAALADGLNVLYESAERPVALGEPLLPGGPRRVRAA